MPFRSTWNISLMWGQAEAWPPGMRLGPYLAPSSPPDTPEPTYRIPFFSNSLHLRVVSWCSEFPPSMIMSPLLNKGINFWMKSSTAWPALTISIILRGFLSFWTMSSSDLAPTTFNEKKSNLMHYVIFKKHFMTVLYTRWRLIIEHRLNFTFSKNQEKVREILFTLYLHSTELLSFWRYFF